MDERINKTDFAKLTACGGDCGGCAHFKEGECAGCIASGGTCIHMWSESGGVCRVCRCCREHGVPFCGLCGEFPCEWLTEWFRPWNADGVRKLAELRDEYLRENE